MTLIIYAQCKNALILISDRKETNTSEAGQITKKYYMPTNREFILELAGEGIIIETIFSDLHIDQSVSRNSVRKKLYDIIEKSPKVGSVDSMSAGLLLIQDGNSFQFNNVWFTVHRTSIVEEDPPFKCYGDGTVLADYLIRKFNFTDMVWTDATQCLVSIMEEVANRIDSVGNLKDYGFDLIVIAKDGDIKQSTLTDGSIIPPINLNFKPNDEHGFEFKTQKITPIQESSSVEPSEQVEKRQMSFSVIADNEKFNVNYEIMNGKLQNIKSDTQAHSLIIQIEPSNSGELTISIPRNLLDSKIEDEDDDFFLLMDGEETEHYDETVTSKMRILTIPFPKGVKEIEIIGTHLAAKYYLEREEFKSSYKSLQEQMHQLATKRNSPIVVQTDKSVYMYGSYMIVTIINPYFIISTPIILSIFNKKDDLIYKNLIPVKAEAKGIYQEIVRIEGKEWFDPGATYRIVTQYGEKSADVTIITSDLGITIELDQKKYTWTDKVFITVVSPDLNWDSSRIETIGNKLENRITISTNKAKLSNYKLVETGEDTGIFIGEITLSGFTGHGVKYGKTFQEVKGNTGGTGPTDGFIATTHEDKITVILVTPSKTVSASAVIGWNVGEINWLSLSYPPDGQGVLRIVDPDMNLNPEKIDKVGVLVWSDSDEKGINIIVEETGPATGIFKGFVNFTTNEKSTGNSLKVSNGDRIVAEYLDMTLPQSHAPSDVLSLRASTKIEFPTPSKQKDSLEYEKTAKPLVIIPLGSSVPGCEETNECFIPSELKIRVNQTVVWKNSDTAAHTVTSGFSDLGPDGNFDSSMFMAGTSFAFTFKQKGKYPYFCMVHPWQTGTIIVE